ncbi:hypothetical protein C0995_013213 [Termitomyces sp. Mi166|nr:hypothetical protein C0995_013213 [Termitomyces sp. Mi166\
MPVTPTLVSGGYYKIVNVAAATIITLSTTDMRILPTVYDHYCLQWLAEEVGNDSWTLRSVYQGEGKAIYLGYDGSATLHSRLAGSTDLRTWNIAQTDRGGAEYRIWLPAGELVADLSYSSQVEGTTIELYGSTDTTNQFWLFERIPVPS